MQVPKFSCSLGAEFHCPLRQHPPLQSHTRVFLQFPHHQEQVGLPVTQAMLATSLEGREGSAAALGKVAGLIPSVYFSFPDLRPTYALTFGNSTRKAYQKEQRRRACAL